MEYAAEHEDLIEALYVMEECTKQLKDEDNVEEIRLQYLEENIIPLAWKHGFKLNITDFDAKSGDLLQRIS